MLSGSKARLGRHLGIGSKAGATLALCAALFVLLALIGSSAQASAQRPFHSCGSVGSSAGAGYGDIHAYGLPCHAARRLIKRALNHGTPPGWTFSYGAGRDEFRKGRKRITGIPLGDRPARAVRRAGKPYLIANERNLFEPPEYCPSNHTCFSEAQWRLWGPRRAVAIATGETSYPPDNVPVTERIKFLFNVPKHICGGYYYTRARWRYAGEARSTIASLVAPVCIWTGA